MEGRLREEGKEGQSKQEGGKEGTKEERVRERKRSNKEGRKEGENGTREKGVSGEGGRVCQWISKRGAGCQGALEDT